MQTEIQAAYAAAHALVDALQAVCNCRNHPMVIPHSVLKKVRGPKRQWKAIQDWRQQPMKKNPPVGMVENIELLQQRYRGMGEYFQPLKLHRERSWVAFGELQVDGKTYVDVLDLLAIATESLLVWARQFVVNFCHEESHVKNSAVEAGLQHWREQCPFNHELLTLLRNRLHKEESQLLRDYVTPGELQGGTAKPSGQEKPRPLGIPETTKAKTIQRYLDDCENIESGKLHKGELKAAKIRVRKRKSEGWTVAKARKRLKSLHQQAEV